MLVHILQTIPCWPWQRVALCFQSTTQCGYSRPTCFVFYHRRTNVLVFKDFLFSIHLVVVLDLGSPPYSWNVFLLIMARSQSLSFQFTQPHKFPLLLLSHITPS